MYMKLCRIYNYSTFSVHCQLFDKEKTPESADQELSSFLSLLLRLQSQQSSLQSNASSPAIPRNDRIDPVSNRLEVHPERCSITVVLMLCYVCLKRPCMTLMYVLALHDSHALTVTALSALVNVLVNIQKEKPLKSPCLCSFLCCCINGKLPNMESFMSKRTYTLHFGYDTHIPANPES